MAGETAGALAWIKAVVPSSPRSHCILHCHKLTEKKKRKKASYRSECPWWGSKVDFIRFWPINTSLQKSEWDYIGNMHKMLSLYTEIQRSSLGLTHVIVEQTTFFTEHHFLLERPMVLQTLVCDCHFLENKTNLSLQRKQISTCCKQNEFRLSGY